MKRKQLVWNVYWFNINSRKIEIKNALCGYEKTILKLYKKYPMKQEFLKAVKSELMYRYWSRAEYEVLITAWCGGDGTEAHKIDIYEQLILNWDLFSEYICNWVTSK